MNNIDTLDRQILRILTKDARTPYAEMAKNFGVSPGTIHVRVEKMRQSGLIEGTKAIIDERKLGYDVCCFIGIILKSAKDYEKVIKSSTLLMKWWKPITPRVTIRFLLK